MVSFKKPTEPAQSYVFELGFDYIINNSKIKAPYSIVPIPGEMSGYIAQIVVSWGQFELAFDNFLQALLRSIGEDLLQSLRALGFPQRTKVFRATAAQVFCESSNILACLTSIVDDAISLHRSRNIIVHGRNAVVAKLDGNGVDPIKVTLSLEFKLERTGETANHNRESLESLFYAMINLLGRINEVSGEPDQIASIQDDIAGIIEHYEHDEPQLPETLTFSERLTLKEFLLRHHPRAYKNAGP